MKDSVETIMVKRKLLQDNRISSYAAMLLGTHCRATMRAHAHKMPIAQDVSRRCVYVKMDMWKKVARTKLEIK